MPATFRRLILKRDDISFIINLNTVYNKTIKKFIINRYHRGLLKSTLPFVKNRVNKISKIHHKRSTTTQQVI